MNFNGKNVLITGARGNLGRAVAQAFAQAGARVVLLDRHAAPLPEAGNGHLALQADLLDAAQLAQAVQQAIQACGRIDVVCNLAGGFAMGPAVHETDAAAWDHLFDMNVRTVLNLARVVVPHLLEAGGGSIVNVGANSAARGLAQMGAYCASKDALVRVTESMSAELRDRSIRVNAVLPSILDTPENRQAMPDAEHTRWVGLDALADVILFLASDAARAVQGALVPVVNRA
ncbi:SDR family NAD(P)-dependent oxidoreductase [Cupriavidus necator]|uniref:SDR family NAD(P)-dependent oxidoreductase n=1 Tax=Cupriavidus necator TaxID=106590 RepID=UPI0005B3CFFD|nr:SDR family NAD(P)-dependent oxidoreductase [Cupriavidus necator]